jgi:hypothetical protein
MLPRSRGARALGYSQAEVSRLGRPALNYRASLLKFKVAKKVLVNFLDLKGVFHLAPYFVADHELG